MLCQSQAMDFRRCAWRLLHSLLTKLINYSHSYSSTNVQESSVDKVEANVQESSLDTVEAFEEAYP